MKTTNLIKNPSGSFGCDSGKCRYFYMGDQAIFYNYCPFCGRKITHIKDKVFNTKISIDKYREDQMKKLGY